MPRSPILQAYTITGLKTLSVQFNSIKMLDSRIFTMNTMKQIFASNNLFQRVPDGVVNFKSLTHVSFPFNKITSVGHSLCSCTTLVHLDLSNNQIATLASEFSHLWNLKFLNFGANSFETSWRQHKNVIRPQSSEFELQFFVGPLFFSKRDVNLVGRCRLDLKQAD